MNRSVTGATPVPVADLFLLAPLQMLLVAAIAGLSCRQPNLETVKEYAVASGVVWAAGMTLREVCRQLIKLLPLPGLTNVVAGKIAAAGTYAVGRSAQAYFFRGEVPPGGVQGGRRRVRQRAGGAEPLTTSAG